MFFLFTINFFFWLSLLTMSGFSFFFLSGRRFVLFPFFLNPKENDASWL